ncbi:hypothetical protein [Levilactobacillus zymae]|uniref:hypothetical protein n=1 Tax=Levilactobacillus zymae TaxID=267363 RepID=UPI000B405F2F|nr:hypothetical protein [Levilactobacillus zymae]
MRKSLKLALTLVAGLTLGTASLNTAKAATWHKGTPKALRGSWIYHRKQVSQFGQITFTASKYQRQDQGMPQTKGKHLKYRYVGHGTYKIHAYIYGAKGTGYHNGWATMTIKKHNGRIQPKGDLWFHRGTL